MERTATTDLELLEVLHMIAKAEEKGTLSHEVGDVLREAMILATCRAELSNSTKKGGEKKEDGKGKGKGEEEDSDLDEQVILVTEGERMPLNVYLAGVVLALQEGLSPLAHDNFSDLVNMYVSHASSGEDMPELTALSVDQLRQQEREYDAAQMAFLGTSPGQPELVVTRKGKKFLSLSARPELQCLSFEELRALHLGHTIYPPISLEGDTPP